MTLEELRNFLFECYKKYAADSITIHIKYSHPEKYNQIINLTEFLPKNCKFSLRVYHVMYEIFKIPHCLMCVENETFFKRFKDGTKGYNKYCKKCQKKIVAEQTSINWSSLSIEDKEKKNEIRKQKTSKTILEKYGSLDVFYEKRYEKIQTTLEEKYGISSPFQLPHVLEKRDKVLLENKNEINEKRRNTYSKLNIEEINEKKKQTNLKRYGVEWYKQTKECDDSIKQTCQKKYGTDYPVQAKEVKEKIRQTNLEKYGVENTLQFEEFKEKAKQSNKDRYGVEYYLSSEIRRKRMEDIGLWLPIEKRTDWQNYQSLVWKETRKHIKRLFKSWDGCCYYTKIKLLERKDEDYNNTFWPTIDHKISVRYGFENNIDSKIIGDIHNLCICSRSENSKKNIKTENEYKKYKKLAN